MAALRDTTKLTTVPDRLRVVSAPKSGSFGEVVGALGSQAMTLEETAILNNLRATTPVSAGSPIKIVRKGKRG
jgi:predicted Zn-dependent protease